MTATAATWDRRPLEQARDGQTVCIRVEPGDMLAARRRRQCIFDWAQKRGAKVTTRMIAARGEIWVRVIERQKGAANG